MTFSPPPGWRAGDAGPGQRRAGEVASLERFLELRKEFAARLDSVRPWDEPRFLRDDWAGRNAELAAALLPCPAPNFLRNPVILYQMFVADKYLASEAPYVLDRLPAPAWAGEDPVGDPPRARLEGSGVTTSANTVHTLHHLLRFEEATGRRLRDVGTVVEWGGGYGNLAKLLVRLRGAVPTLVLIDSPVFAAVQWLYLASILGPDAVVLHAEPGIRPRPGAVNVVPIGLAAQVEVAADLFVSTWALNECTPAAQDHVVERNWFGAEALLLAMHRGDPFERRVLDAGARAVPLGPFMPAQQYLVR
jgi:hypothetical protein